MTWVEKYELLLKERLITKDIMNLTGWNHATVKEFRIDLVANLSLQGITLSNNMKIPTELFLDGIGKDLDYYKDKAIREVELIEIKKRIVK